MKPILLSFLILSYALLINPAPLPSSSALKKSGERLLQFTVNGKPVPPQIGRGVDQAENYSGRRSRSDPLYGVDKSNQMGSSGGRNFGRQQRNGFGSAGQPTWGSGSGRSFNGGNRSNGSFNGGMRSNGYLNGARSFNGFGRPGRRG